MLEQKLQDLDALKDEQFNTIDEFNTQYSLSVGDLVEKILKRKEELLVQSVAKIQEAFEEEEALYKAFKHEAKTLEDAKHYPTTRKMLYIVIENVISLEIGKFLKMITPNIFRYEDMKIVFVKLRRH